MSPNSRRDNPVSYFNRKISRAFSLQDEFACILAPNYFETAYGELISKIGHGKIYLFDTGGHPAMLTNQDRFYQLSVEFFE